MMFVIKSKNFSMKLLKVKNLSLSFRIQRPKNENFNLKVNLKVEKVKNFQRN